VSRNGKRRKHKKEREAGREDRLKRRPEEWIKRKRRKVKKGRVRKGGI
jgi:hypothetical protein